MCNALHCSKQRSRLWLTVLHKANCSLHSTNASWSLRVRTCARFDVVPLQPMGGDRQCKWLDTVDGDFIRRFRAITSL